MTLSITDCKKVTDLANHRTSLQSKISTLTATHWAEVGIGVKAARSPYDYSYTPFQNPYVLVELPVAKLLPLIEAEIKEVEAQLLRLGVSLS